MKLIRSASLVLVLCCSLMVPAGFSGFLDDLTQTLKTVASETPKDPNKPFIEVSTSELKGQIVAGENALDAGFGVKNSGAGTLNFTVKSNMPWIEAIPAQGTSSGGAEQKINLRFKTADLKEGSYVAPVVVEDANAQNSPRTVFLRLEVLPSAVLVLDQRQVSAKFRQGESAGDSTFVIRNQGAGTLNYSLRTAYSIDSGSPWMTAEPGQGKIAGGQSASVTVKMKSSAMPAGTHMATIEVIAPGAKNSPQSVQVTALVMTNDILSLSAQALSAEAVKGKPVDPQILRVENTGSSGVPIRIETKDKWLSVTPGSRTLQGGEEAVLTVHYDTNSLQPGDQTCEIVITDESAKISKKIPVTLKLTTPPVIKLEVQSLELRTEAGKDLEAAGSFTLANEGDGTLHYQCVKDASWLELDPVSGKLEKNNSAQIRLNIRASGLKAGEYPAVIQVLDPNAENSPQKLPLKLTVEAVSSLRAEPSQINREAERGQDPKREALILKNEGSEDVKFKISSDAAWVTVTPQEGAVLKGGQSSLTVVIDTSSLEGEQKAQIRVEAEGLKQPVVIPVTVKVKIAGGFSVDPASLSSEITRGGDAPAGAFELANSGSVPFAYAIKTTEDWLKVEPAQGTVPAGQKTVFQVIYKTKDLGIGDYKTEIEVCDPKAKTAKKIPVGLTVKAKAPKQPAASEAGPCDYVVTDDLWTKDQEATDKTQFGENKIPGVFQGLILNYAEKGERDSERTSVGNSFSADEVELSYSREKSMVVNDPTYGPQKQRLWNMDVRINLFSPRGEWGGFQKRMYATRKEWVKSNYQYGAKDASPVKGADESFVTKKIIDGGQGKTSEEWHFAVLKDGAVVYFNASTSPDTLKLMGQQMDFYPMVERILSEISKGGWRAIFKKGNPKFDRLPAPLKPLVINAGIIPAERIYLATDKMPGGGKQAGLSWMLLSYHSEPIVPFHENSSDEPAWEHSVKAQFFYPFKGGEKFVQSIIDNRFKTSSPNVIYTKVSLGDGGYKQVGEDPRYTHYEFRVGAAFVEIGFISRNKKFLDPPQERIDEIIQKIREVDYEALFSEAGGSPESSVEDEELDESAFEEAPPVILEGDFWDPKTGANEELLEVSLQGGAPQSAGGPKPGDKNEQGQVWSPVAGGGWVKPEIYESDVSMIGQGKVYTDQWGWVDEKEAKDKQANYQKFQAANQVSDRERQKELQKLSQDIRDTKQKIKDMEAKHEKVEALRNKLDKLEEQRKQDELDARWNSKATMTNTAQLAAREIVTGSDAEGGTSYKAMALRMLMGSVTVGYSEVAYNTADASYQVYDHLKNGDSILGAVAKATVSMATSEVVGRAQAGVMSWGAKKSMTAVRTAFGQAAEVGTDGLSKSLTKKKTAVEKVLAIKDEAARAEAIKKLYRGGGMEELSQLERKGHLGTNDVAKMNQVITQEIHAAVDTGVKKTMNEFEKNTGVKIKEVMVGDSGSSAARKVRSVNTDADFASLPKFDEASLKNYADRNFGGDLVKANEKLSKKFAKAQDAFVDESLRTKGLSSSDVGYQTYDRFGAGAGPGDSYSAGFVRTRQATQGKTTVFKPGEGGEIQSYKTSGQAMTDQDLLIRKDVMEKELKRLNEKTEGLSPRESAYMDAKKKDLEKELKKISGEDSPKTERGEAKDIMKQQEKALGKGGLSAEKASKALERADKALALEKKAGIDPALVEKARLIRKNPQQAKQILGAMSEEEFVKQIDDAVSQAGLEIKGK
jgi:hypothetical protein